MWAVEKGTEIVEFGNMCLAHFNHSKVWDVKYWVNVRFFVKLPFHIRVNFQHSSLRLHTIQIWFFQKFKTLGLQGAIVCVDADITLVEYNIHYK